MPNIFCRPGTFDKLILTDRDYDGIVDYRPEDVWLDGGAHIGTFCVRAAERVAHVEAYEPEPGNYETLVLNLERNGVQNVVPYQIALVGNDDAERTLWTHPSRNQAAHSFFRKQDRFEPITVPCVHIHDAIVGCTCVKLDVEGAEQELVYSIHDWTSIRLLVIEFHRKVLAKGPESMAAYLAQHFDTVEVHGARQSHPIIEARRGVH